LVLLTAINCMLSGALPAFLAASAILAFTDVRFSASLLIER
jgi:hypothetical protein